MNDAIGYLIRIDNTPAIIITLGRFGLVNTASHTMLQVIQKVLYHIKTGYGTSGSVYGNKIVSLAGCGQGNRIGPMIWALISTTILII